MRLGKPVVLFHRSSILFKHLHNQESIPRNSSWIMMCAASSRGTFLKGWGKERQVLAGDLWTGEQGACLGTAEGGWASIFGVISPRGDWMSYRFSCETTDKQKIIIEVIAACEAETERRIIQLPICISNEALICIFHLPLLPRLIIFFSHELLKRGCANNLCFRGLFRWL